MGFMNTFSSIVNKVMPSRVVIAWEGGGSVHRRAIYGDYKKNRRPSKLNRFYETDQKDDSEDFKREMLVLVNAMKHAGVTQVYVSDCEADDVIACLCDGRFADDRKVIVSSDKDLYQLLDERTIIYSLHKKAYVTMHDMKRETGIDVGNFVLAKAMCGDSSDNIPGIPRLGFKTLVKRMPEFASSKRLSVDDVMQAAEAAMLTSKVKVHEAISRERSLIERNLRLVDLRSVSILSPWHVEKINGAIDGHVPAYNKLGLIKTLLDAGINDYDFDRFWSSIRCTMVNHVK